jgi:hypothetical protein
MAVPVAAAVVACGGRGAAVQQTTSRSVSTASQSGSSEQRCVQRWNEKLKKTGSAALKKVPHIASYKVHVGTEKKACLVIILRTGGAIIFGALPGSSNYQFIPAQGKRVRPSLLVPNAHFDSNLKLALG